MEKDNVIYLPAPKELTDQQRRHWEDVEEQAERLLENARRMLGRGAIERGLEG